MNLLRVQTVIISIEDETKDEKMECDINKKSTKISAL